MADINVFKDQAVRTIREHIADTALHRRNKPLRHPEDESDIQTPEVYIARPQSASGIPALTPESGTGIEDTPGSDTCDIYKINPDGELIPVNFTRVVYNLTSSDILQDSWNTIHKTKYGEWVILPESVGGAYIAKPQSAGGIPALTRDTGTGTDDVAGSDTCDIYQLNASDEIVIVEGLSLEVFNITEEIIPQDWVLIVKTNFGKWIAVPSGGSATVIAWGKVQGSPTNQSGATSLTVSVKECDIDGTNVTGDAFNVLTPLRPNEDTALFEDYVVGWIADKNGVKAIVTNCFDEPIGSIKPVNADSAIRDGWRLCDNVATSNLRGKVLVGFDSTDADYDAIADAGGFTTHGGVTNDHDDHEDFTHVHLGICCRTADRNLDGLTADFWWWSVPGGSDRTDVASNQAASEQDLFHSETDNRQPFYTVKYIERFE